MIPDLSSRFHFLIRIKGQNTNTTGKFGIYGGNGIRGYHNIGIPDCSVPVETPVPELCTQDKQSFQNQPLTFAQVKYFGNTTIVAYEFNIPFKHATVGMYGNCLTKNNNYHVLKRTGFQKGEIVKTKTMIRFIDERDPDLCMTGAQVNSMDDNGNNMLAAGSGEWYSFRFDLEGHIPMKQGKVGIYGGYKISYYDMLVPDCSGNSPPVVEEDPSPPSTCENYPMKVSEVDLIGSCPPVEPDLTSPPTKAPTPPPTDRPTFPPTKAPTFPPTKAPTLPPTDRPTRSPTKAPTLPPTKAPTLPPTNPPGPQAFCFKPNGCNAVSCAFQCPTGIPAGYYPDLIDCRSYCKCTGTTAHSRYETCQHGLLWDPRGRNAAGQTSYNWLSGVYGRGTLWGSNGGICNWSYNINDNRPQGCP